MRTRSLAALAAFTIGTLAGSLQARDHFVCDERQADHACEIRESSMPASGHLDVDAAPNGGISIRASDGGEILIRAKVETWGESDSEAKAMLTKLHIEAANGRIRTAGPHEENWGRHNHQGWSVSYEIRVPARIDLTLKSVNGGISVDGVKGALDADTVNGGISLTAVAGHVHGTTINGGVNVLLAASQLDSEGMTLKTTNGGVTVSVPGSFAGRIAADTVHGGMSSDFPGHVSEEGRWGVGPRHFELSLGSGGGPVHVETVNGGVSIRRHEV
jgi:hypothetical protein